MPYGPSTIGPTGNHGNQTPQSGSISNGLLMFSADTKTIDLGRYGIRNTQGGAGVAVKAPNGNTLAGGLGSIWNNASNDNAVSTGAGGQFGANYLRGFWSNITGTWVEYGKANAAFADRTYGSGINSDTGAHGGESAVIIAVPTANAKA